MWSLRVNAARNPNPKVIKVQKIITQQGPTRLQMTDSYTESQQLNSEYETFSVKNSINSGVQWTWRICIDNLQVIISVLIGTHSNGKAKDDSREAISHRIIKAHMSVIHIPQFRQHPIQMDGFDQKPRENAQPNVV